MIIQDSLKEDEEGNRKPNVTLIYDIKAKTLSQGASLNKYRDYLSACYLNQKVYVTGG